MWFLDNVIADKNTKDCITDIGIFCRNKEKYEKKRAVTSQMFIPLMLSAYILISEKASKMY